MRDAATQAPALERQPMAGARTAAAAAVAAVRPAGAPALQQPVLVLDMEEAPPDAAEAGTLGFARLQVSSSATSLRPHNQRMHLSNLPTAFVVHTACSCAWGCTALLVANRILRLFAHKCTWPEMTPLPGACPR